MSQERCDSIPNLLVQERSRPIVLTTSTFVHMVTPRGIECTTHALGARRVEYQPPQHVLPLSAPASCQLIFFETPLYPFKFLDSNHRTSHFYPVQYDPLAFRAPENGAPAVGLTLALTRRGDLKAASRVSTRIDWVGQDIVDRTRFPGSATASRWDTVCGKAVRYSPQRLAH